MLLPASGHKIAILPSSKCRRHGQRFKKQLDPNFTAVTVTGSLSAFASLASLSVSLAGSNEPATAASFLGIAGLAAMSAHSGNLVKNCVEFCNLG